MKTHGIELLPTFSNVETNYIGNYGNGLNETVQERRVYYRLSESEAFQYMDRHASPNGGRIIDDLPKMVMPDQGFIQVDLDHLDQSVKYELFESRLYNMSCTKDIKKNIETGRLIPVYTETIKIPTAIPYILQGEGPGAKAVFNVSDFLTLDKLGMFQINDQRNYGAFMASMVSAAFARKAMFTASALPADLSDCIVLTYADMLCKCFNSVVSLDRVGQDKIRYLVSEFALIQMYGTETGQKHFYNRFSKMYFPRLSKIVTDAIDAQFKVDNFDRLSLFIAGLKDINPSMRGLTELVIYERWTRMYRDAAVLAIDYIGYVMYVIMMVIFNSPLINRAIVEPIVKTSTEPVLSKSHSQTLYRRIQQFLED